MPELPDLVAYIEALRRHIVGRRLDRLLLSSPFVLRSVDPPLESIFGSVATAIDRIGKRLVLTFAGGTGRKTPEGTAREADRDRFLVIHLMIAGRLRWRPAGAAKKGPGVSPKLVLAAFEFEHGTLFFTEASSKKRASMQMAAGTAAVRALDPGGIEPLEVTREQFDAALTRESHTVKRALTDPHLFSGIGNAYSDEILHAARLSPLQLTRSLTAEERARLFESTRATLTAWIDRLREEAAGGFPDKVTAFRPEMAVHGRFRKPCPVCGTPVQRIVYAANECNYCARCQTGGRLLADRSLSRLLRDDWPRSIDEL
ncbi:MAG: DNA-formamidopyrimidine glycosylase family protein [Acidobacteriota bacterium]